MTTRNDKIHVIGMALHLHHILHDEYSKILEAYNLVPRQFGILTTGSKLSLTQSKLAQFLLMDKNIVGVMIDALENRGMLYRKKNPKNRRENLIIITDKGKNLALEIETKVLQAQRKCLSCLNDEEFEDFCACMKKINDNLLIAKEKK